MTPPSTPWFDHPDPRPNAQHTLICFPHAGGSASFYRDWGPNLPEFDVHPVLYPGRGARIDEASPTDLERLACEIADAAVAVFALKPVSLFGHSMGASLALETARHLEARGARVEHLFASGSCDGPCPDLSLQPISDADVDDATLCRQLTGLGGTDPELAADPMFQELIIPYVRSDSRMFHEYAMKQEPRLSCPVTSIVGDADDNADQRPWRELTTGEFFEREVVGDHFYLVSAPPFALMRERLNIAPSQTRRDP